jgi:hypothetical protein
MWSMILLSSASVCIAGCGIIEYPEAYSAPDFEVYRLTRDAVPDWWECAFERRGTVCEATITRTGDDHYVLELGVSSNDMFTWSEVSQEDIEELTDEERETLELTRLPTRALTDEEVVRMKVLFADLHVNRHPFPFNIVCCLGLRLEELHRWDDVELGTHTYDGVMIDFRDSGAIVSFLGEFVPDELSE